MTTHKIEQILKDNIFVKRKKNLNYVIRMSKTVDKSNILNVLDSDWQPHWPIGRLTTPSTHYAQAEDYNSGPAFY